MSTIQKAGFESVRQFLVSESGLHGGWQKVFKFENGYGASVVCHNGSYGGESGLCEIAVVALVGGKRVLCYDTPITDDVIGCVEPEDVASWLFQIAALPKQRV